MIRKALVIVLAVAVVLAAAVALYARSVLSSESVRATVEAQLSARLGRPVRVTSAGASIFPRVALELRGITAGEPADVNVARVSVSTGLRGLISRRVEDAEIRVVDGRMSLSALLAMAAAAGPAAASPFTATPAITVESIRTISLENIDLIADGVSLRLDLRSSLAGDRLAVSSITAHSERTRMEGSGEIDTHGRTAQFAIEADPLDLDELLSLSSAFSSGTSTRSSNAASGNPFTLRLDVTAPRGRFADYDFTQCKASMVAAGTNVTLPSLAFRIFGGEFSGALEMDVSGATPRMQLRGKAGGIDVTQLAAAAGREGSISGRLATDLSVTTLGADMAAMLRAARGTADATITDGMIPGLDMVRTIVLAFGKPSGAPPSGSGSAFTRLGGGFRIENGAVSTSNLAFASRDFDMRGIASLQVASGVLDAATDVVLSRELTAQAGTDLRRLAQSDGRVIVPARISGTLANPSISLDLAAATRRALENELKRRTRGLFEDLFKRKKGGGGA